MARPQKFRHQREDLTDPKVAEKLGRFVIEIEDLRAQRSKIDELLAAAYDAVDEGGFEKKFVRKVVSLRAKEEGVRRDEEDGLESYEFAIEKGVSLARTRRKPANDQFDPVTGEFVEDIRTAPVTAEVPTSEQSEGNGSRDHQHVHSRQTDEAKHGGQDGEPAGADHASHLPETANEVPAQDGGGTALGESHGDKSNAARPASVDAHVNDGRLAGEASAEVVTVVGTESGTVAISQSDDGAVAAVNGKAGLANAYGVEPPSSGHTETPSAEREDRAAANTALPAKSSIRPLCRDPGETCGGYGRKHCRACEMAAAELEEVA